jgi:hypothetical protein
MSELEVRELAKELFIKSYKPDQYLTDKTEAYTVSTIRNSIAVAKLFYDVLNKEHNPNPSFSNPPEDIL